MDEIEFAGVVICCNEEKHLPECLDSMSFCRELVVVDLESTDSSASVARAHGAQVQTHLRVPVAEPIRPWSMQFTSLPWVVFLDPDMVLPASTAASLRTLITSDPAVGLVEIPYRNYFRGRPLRGTRWGGVRYFRFVVHRERTVIPPFVHAGAEVLAPWHAVRGEHMEPAAHHWGGSFAQLFRKHRRYLSAEGERMYQRFGSRFSWRRAVHHTLRETYDCFVPRRGFACGWEGYALTAFWAWYVWNRWQSLRVYQRSLEANPGK